MFNQFINASGTIENDIEMNRLVTLTVSLPFTKKKKTQSFTGAFISMETISPVLIDPKERVRQQYTQTTLN